MSILTLKNDDKFILYEIPAGKPYPNQKLVSPDDNRDRVKQNSIKGPTSSYYTFNFIRLRIGKNPPNDLLQARKIEILCSKRRKELTKLESTFPVSTNELYSASDSEVLKQINRENAREFLKDLIAVPSFIKEDASGRLSIQPFVQEFITQTEHANLLDFLLYKWSLKFIEINKKFLNNFETDVAKMVDSQAWKASTVFKRAEYLDHFVRDTTADLYNLGRSNWRPIDGSDSLIRELRLKGPLMIFGQIGVSFYVDEPFKLKQKIAGRNIYGWRPGATRIESLGSNSILLVGARKVQDKALVYFIDANDSSCPNDRDCQKIYTITFENLKQNICSLAGFKLVDSDEGYAYCKK